MTAITVVNNNRNTSTIGEITQRMMNYMLALRMSKYQAKNPRMKTPNNGIKNALKKNR